MNAEIGNGVSTQPEVERLTLHFADRKEGDLIPYDTIAQMIGAKVGTHRFRTVVQAWRRQLWREQQVVLIAQINDGYLIANPSQRSHHSHSKYKNGLRRIKRAGEVASATDVFRLTPEERKLCEHVIRGAAAIRLAEATAAKVLKKPDPTLSTKQLPAGE